jgi:thioredoxin reductase
MPYHRPIVVIGAGPVGLAAAAHLLGRGETPVIFEAGDAVGQSIRAWAHVHMFSLWGLNVDRAGADGLPAIGALRPRYADRTTMVVGSGHSALNALLELAKLKASAPGTRILWAARRERIRDLAAGTASVSSCAMVAE